MDRSLLARATDSSEAPTPGYIYVDLAKQAGGNPAVCADMARYLTNRLSTKQNVYVKTKCCKVLAKLCEQVPRNAFRRVLAQDAQAVACIKQALQHRGPLDPLQGDAKNEAVRAAAREALDAVYAEAPAESHHMPSGGGGGGGSMSGYGGGGGVSSSYGAPPHAANGGSGSRMQGIGNPMFSDPRLQQQSRGGGGAGLPPNVQAAVKEAGEVVMGMIRDPLARNVGSSSQQHNHNPNVPSQGHSGDLPGYNRSYGRPPPGATELSRKTNGEWTMASNRGPGAYNNNSYYQQRAAAHAQQPGGTSVSSGGVGGSWANASVPTGGVASAAREPAYSTPSITITPGRTPATSGATSDGSYEKNLITELCPPGGLKAVPPADKLQDFIRAVPTLNADWICPVLLDALEDGQPWIIRAKALCVMEAAIAHGQGADGSHPYRDFFYACADEIAPLAHHNRAAIAEPARRVLQLLGVEGGGGGGGGGAPVSAPPVAAAPNLLDFGDDDAAPTAAPPASAPPPPPAPAAPSTGGGSSLFGGMQVKSKAAAPAAPVPVASSPAPDLFDFGASAPAPAALATAPASAVDPFGSTASAHSTESAPTSMFANLQVKDDAASTSSAPAPATPAPAPATGGSAFGFINKTSEEKKTSTSPAAPPSFDPLLALGGSGAATQAHHNKMQMSPEQMQALAYQQLMMQQQMQQMQMAMMRGTAPPMPPVFRQGSGGVAPGGPQMTPQQMQQMMMMQQQQRQSMTMQNAKAAKKDDKKFDFVKDAMFSEKKH